MDQNENFQQQPYPQYQGREPLPNATTILILGILSIVVCQLLGIVALIMGNNSIDLYKRNPGSYSAESYNNVKAGRICGIIGICLLAFVIIFWIVGASIFIPFWRRGRLDY